MKLDRSRWEGCEFCNEKCCESCISCTVAIDEYPCKVCKGFSEFESFYFCPYCGKPICEEAWVELERMIFGRKYDT